MEQLVDSKAPAPAPPEVEPEEPAVGTVIIPEPPPLEQASPPWVAQTRAALAGKLLGQGLGPTALAAFALGPAVVAAISIGTGHFGLGAVLGLMALAGAWMATAPGATEAGAEPVAPPAFARVLAHLAVVLLLAGSAMEGAAAGAPYRTAAALWALVAVLLLPLVRALAPEGVLQRGPMLWSFAERSTVYLAGLLLGHPAFGAFLVAVVATADLALRLAFVLPRAPERAPLPPDLQAWFTRDGRPKAGVRLGCRLTLAAAILLFAVLGRSEAWSF